MVSDVSSGWETLQSKGDSSSSQSSRSVSSERSSSWLTTPSSYGTLQLRHPESTYQHEHRSDSSLLNRDILESSTICGPQPTRRRDSPDQQKQLEDWTAPRSHDPRPPTSQHLTISLTQTPTPSGLTNLRPSRHQSPTRFEDHLNTRIDRLWGTYGSFAAASSKGLGVSPLFGRTLSELFRQSRQMAENVRTNERTNELLPHHSPPYTSICIPD